MINETKLKEVLHALREAVGLLYNVSSETRDKAIEMVDAIFIEATSTPPEPPSMRTTV